MHKELKNEFIRHSTLIFHPLCTIPIENFHPNRNFFLLKCIFQHPARGLVFGPDENSTIEIKRLESTDLNFTTKKAAEEQALNLFRAWIDEQSSESNSKS